MATKEGVEHRKKTVKKENGKAKKSSAVGGDAPIFLRKTFHMVETADPELACWSEDGTMFIVKDPERFASMVIPKFFKHSNFSSFGEGFYKLELNYVDYLIFCLMYCYFIHFF